MFGEMTSTVLLGVLVVLILAGFVSAAEIGDAGRPKVLIVCWRRPGGLVDFGFLQRLKKQGINVDYAEDWREFTWERISKYNALMLYSFPYGEDPVREPSTIPVRGGPGFGETMELLERYLEAGGGVMLDTQRAGGSVELWRNTQEALGRWGARLPMELIKVSPADTRPHPRLRGMPFFYTENVAQTPVSEGVEGIWWPNPQRGHVPLYMRYSGPIEVDESWQVVVRGPEASRTYPFVPRDEDQYPEHLRLDDAHVRPGGVEEPALFAVRDLDPGRLALFHCLSVFHVGSGTSWLHDGAMLDRGLGGKRSDFGRLLANTFRWLAAPSMEKGTLGGAKIAGDRVLPPLLRPGVLEEFGDPARPRHKPQFDLEAPPREVRIFRGLIGARTSYSGGRGTVEDYARTAKDAGLDFVVFLEHFPELSQEELEQLTRECREASDEEMLLMPGYRMDSNIGNRMFFYGRDPLYPHDKVLSRRVEDAFMLQGETPEGEFTRRRVPGLGFLIKEFMGKVRVSVNNAGFFHFTRAARRGGMSLQHCKAFGGAGVMFYEDGRLVEDVTGQYLKTNAGCMSALPLAINLVDSPGELAKSVERGDAMTLAGADSLDGVVEALNKNHQFEGPPVSASSGPVIRLWPGMLRPFILGDECFANGPALMDADLHVTSGVGLEEIAIYDGTELFRRFLPGGAEEFHRRLYLSALRQQNLTLVATDVEGGRAVAFPRQCRKAGAQPSVGYCGDHVNHCTNMNMKMGRGPLAFPAASTPPIPAAGYTWDGGPQPVRRFIDLRRFAPVVRTEDAEQSGPLYQYPVLQSSDERLYRGSYRVSGVCAPGGNPWRGWGPIVPPRIFDGEASFTELAQYVEGVDPTKWGGPGMVGGSMTSIYEHRFRYVKAATVRSFRLSASRRDEMSGLRAILLTGREDELLTAHDATPTGQGGSAHSVVVPEGGWFAGISEHPSNRFLSFNHGAPLRVRTSGNRVQIGLAVPEEGLAVERNEVQQQKLVTITWPMGVDLDDSQDVLRVIRYLREPDGLDLRRGSGVKDGLNGLVEFRAEGGAVEYEVSRTPAGVPPTSLPVRVHGLNRRWSVGLYQIEGFVGKGYYSDGRKVYRPLGVDEEGRAALPVYAQKAPKTHHVVGHPVVADGAGEDLFIQVTALTGPFEEEGKEPAWHVSVNNPTDRSVTATLRAGMELPGLELGEREVTLEAGEDRVLVHPQ